MGLSLSRSNFFSSCFFSNSSSYSVAPELSPKIQNRNRTEKVVIMQSGRKRVRLSGGDEDFEIELTSSKNPQTRKRAGEAQVLGVEPPLTRRRARTLAACTSPRISASSAIVPQCYLDWCDADIWTEVAKFLDGPSLVQLSLSNRWFYRLIMHESIWRYAFFRDLQIPPAFPLSSAFKWIHLYAAAFDGSHAYTFRQQEKHIDWMRIGAFTFESPMALLLEKLIKPRRLPDPKQSQEQSIENDGACIVTNVRQGVWIADLQLVRCPVCNLSTCEGTMQILDARHSELFLETGYKTELWDFVDLGTRRLNKTSDVAAGGILDLKYLNSSFAAEIFDLKAWAGKEKDWQPKARVNAHAVAANTNLQPNDGLHVRFQVMRSGGEDCDIVAIRISQQLV